MRLDPSFADWLVELDWQLLHSAAVVAPVIDDQCPLEQLLELVSALPVLLVDQWSQLVILQLLDCPR